MRRMLAITVLLAGALLAREVRAAQLISVLPLEVQPPPGAKAAEGISKATRTAIEGMVSDVTIDTLHGHGWTVISAESTRQILHDNGMKLETCLDQACELEMARALKADAFLVSGVKHVDGRFELILGILETGKGDVLASEQIFGQSIKALRESFEAKASDFFSHARTLGKPGESGGIRLSGTPAGATVEMVGADGFTASGKLPYERVGLTPQTYHIRVFHPGFTDRDTVVEVKAGELTSLELNLENEAVAETQPKNGATAPPAPPDVATPPPDAVRRPSGLAFKFLAHGNNTKRPSDTSRVKVHYTGWTTDGKMFDSSVVRGQPIEFPLNRVIPGWSEAVQQMTVGDIVRAWIPEELAYKGRPGAPAGMLVFDIELLNITETPQAPPTPPDVAKPPRDAQRTRSGLASKVLTRGTGTQRPAATSKVKVHYTGWTTDGKMFDTSITRGQPATFPLDGVIPGWSESVQLMVEGEKRRVWIPQDLAYKGAEGPPKGMLVFDIELLEILP